ncbi:RHS repeat domain-containing protein [Aquimarina sp. AU119]|uniref:RHS repeat domain-containing protein n=1 Tax=Aquimarina sp. AU119 TaxID=2108528 RepID=UPI000D68720B|nr:RHS repeat-associated core domain-containing protein [Aquimarina sp. AU119]
MLWIFITNTAGNITYIYDATGAKLKKIAPSGSSLTETEYAGNYIYKNDNLEFFNHPEGYVEPVIASGSAAISSFDYVYQYKDHLGNIRLSYKDADGDGIITQNEIVEEKNYYPFGLQHKGYNNTITGREHNYGYNSKEEQNELGLEWLDYGARNYDASLGRWMNLDPLANKYYPISPYAYVANNPIMFIDPDGKRIILPKNKQERRLVRRTLRKLRRSSKTARSHIRRLKRDKNHDVTIKVTNNPRAGSRFISKNAKASSTKGEGSGGTLTWNSNDTTFKSDKNVDGTNTASSSRNLLEEVVHASRSVAGEQAEGDSKANLGNEWKSSFNNANEEVETNEIVNESLVEIGQDEKQRTTYTMTFLKKDENGSIVDKKKVSLPIPVTKKEEEK